MTNSGIGHKIEIYVSDGLHMILAHSRLNSSPSVVNQWDLYPFVEFFNI